jgi:hypothetical protein
VKRHAIAIRCSVLAGLVCLLASGGARAQSCLNDIDCPDTACGGQVCDYTTGTPTCKAAGSQPKGMDGWCSQDSDCKCASLGAKCSSLVYCTFTLPSQAPGANGGHGGGAAGASGATGGTAGSAGTSGAAGASAPGTGGAGTAGHAGGGDGGSSGGCSIAGASKLGDALGCTLLASLGLAAAIFRRRRAAR